MSHHLKKAKYYISITNKVIVGHIIKTSLAIGIGH
jgi:hypothetical protein